MNTEKEKAFVLETVKQAKSQGEGISLETVTDNFVEKYDSSGKPGLFDAIRQLREEGLIKINNHGQNILLSLADAQ